MPIRLGALRFGGVAVGGSAEFASKDGLLAPDFKDHGKDLGRVITDAAVSSVVPVPRNIRVEGVEFGKRDGCDASGRAVDHKPTAALPHPLGGFARLVRQAVIDAESSANDEDGIGNVMRVAGGEFLQFAVNEERADLHVRCVVFTGSEEEFDGHELAKANDVSLGGTEGMYGE